MSEPEGLPMYEWQVEIGPPSSRAMVKFRLMLGDDMDPPRTEEFLDGRWVEVQKLTHVRDYAMADLAATVKALREERATLAALALEVSNRATEACSRGIGEDADPQAVILAKAAEDLHSRLASPSVPAEEEP